MKDEFDRIMEFFTLSPEEKENHLQDIFEDSVEYFEHFKHILINGTSEEKKQAIERMGILKDMIEKETKKMVEKTGLSEEQMSKLSVDPKNFSEEQWDAIEGAKKKLQSGVEEIKEIVEEQTKGKAPPKKEGEEPKKTKKKPKHWLPS